MASKTNPDEILTIFFKVNDENQKPLNHGFIEITFPDNTKYSEEIKNGDTKIDVPGNKLGEKFRIEYKIPGYQLNTEDTSTLSTSGQEVNVVVNKSRSDIPREKSNSDRLELKRFAVLLSGELDYNKEILKGFEEVLDKELPMLKCEPDITSKFGCKEPNAEANYLKEIDNFLGEEYDFYISIGTQASEALYKYLENKNIEKPLIFLGVTDPIKSNLVLSLENRSDKKNIAGISYCGSVLNIAAKIHSIFPENKMIYIHNKGYKQDAIFAEDLKGTRFEKEEILFIKEIDQTPSIEDFNDEKAIYFSWYTIEKMLEEDEGRKILSQRNVVSSTKKNVKNKRAPIAITADDRNIGQKGAEIIVDYLENGTPFGEMDVHIPEIYCYVNCEILKEKNLDINADIIQNARERFDCD